MGNPHLQISTCNGIVTTTEELSTVSQTHYIIEQTVSSIQKLLIMEREHLRKVLDKCKYLYWDTGQDGDPEFQIKH